MFLHSAYSLEDTNTSTTTALFRSAMRFTLLLLLSMPAVVLAIQCLVGSGTSQDDTAAFSPKDCGAGEQYCYIVSIRSMRTSLYSPPRSKRQMASLVTSLAS